MNEARLVMESAAAYSAQHGSEKRGFLSYERGFLPVQNPLTTLPSAYRAWDELAGNLPRHYRDLSLRQAVDALPVLSADSDSLPDAFLSRAAAFLGITTHAYVRVRTAPPARLPDSLMQPWQTVSERLERPAPLLSYIDLIMYNWRLRDQALAPTVENLDLLFPTVGNEAERIFYMTQLEMVSVFTPAVSAIIRAQEAAESRELSLLERELTVMIECLQRISEVTFQKIDPNPFSSTYVDQVLWGKTVAPLAVPVRQGAPGPSGTATPIVLAMDAVLGRSKYETTLGREARHLGDVAPFYWREFARAVRQFSIRDVIERSNSRRLKGVYNTLLQAFAGDKGFLGVHRMKTFGFLELAFKVGRIVTVGNFAGQFKDRIWHQVDHELSRARDERIHDIPQQTYAGLLDGDQSRNIGEVSLARLQIPSQGLYYRAGDRCGVLPENDPEIVGKTLKALNAHGDVAVKLTAEWRQAVALRPGQEETSALPLGQLLAYMKLRPVLRSTAKTLFSLTSCHTLGQIINQRAEDQWELWDLLELLKQSGFDPRRLWRAEVWEPEHLCRMVPPETFRLYSISSAPEAHPDLACLTAANLSYRSLDDEPYSHAIQRRGTASHYLRRLTKSSSTQPIVVKIVPASGFHLPRDPARPILMFAAGSGIAPFIGFLQSRIRETECGENWLFYATRAPETFLYGEDLAAFVRQGRLRLAVAFSAADYQVRCVPGDERLEYVPGRRRRITELMHDPEYAGLIWDLIRTPDEGGQGGVVYVCGRTEYAVAIRRAFEGVIAMNAGGVEQTKRFFYKMVAGGRYKQDVFTTYTGSARQIRRQIDVSELVQHNDRDPGYWMAVGGRVYDLTEFLYVHPGGNRIILSNAGVDATEAYRKVLHHLNPEVDSLLGMYEIGVMRRLDFKNETGVAIGEQGLKVVSVADAFRHWVRYLYLITELQNALRSDYSFLDQSLTQGEPAGSLTSLRVQLMIEAHKRFLGTSLDGLTGDDLHDLWAMSIGLFAPSEHTLWLRSQIMAIHDEYQPLNGATERLSGRLDVPGGEDLVSLAQLCERIAAADAAFVAETKDAIRMGLIPFERDEAAVARQGTAVIDCLKRMPEILRRYYAALQQLTPEMPLGEHREPSSPLVYAPGHGGRIV